MPGPSVVVRVLGDVSNLSKSFTDSGSKAKSAALAASSAFGGMLSTLNRTGVLGPFGEALDTVNGAFEQIVEHGKKVSDVALGAGGALVGIGTAFAALGSKEQAAHQQLATAIDNTGHSYEQYGSSIEEAIKHEEHYGNSSVQTQAALQALTQATHSPSEALKLLSTATDLAAAKHEDLGTAATALGKVYNGNTKLLKEYGITVDKHTHLTDDGKTAYQALADVLSGQAAAASDTFNGKVKAVTTTIEDQVSMFGEKYGPALQGAGAVLTGLGATIKIVQAAVSLFSASEDAAAASADTLAASETAADAAGLPLIATVGLVVAAIAALGVAAYEIYTHWQTIWSGMKDAAEAVWSWLKDNWPYLLGIITGPIGLAAAAIYKHWDTIKGYAVAVYNWLRDTWDAVEGFIETPIQNVANWVGTAWNTVSGGIKTLYGWIRDSWGAVEGWITAPFKAAFNFIATAWNDTVGKLSFHLPGWIPVIGGKGFSMPQIPHLAQGGLITQTGIVYAHAGEVISPAPAAADRGPLVHVENVNNNVDIDLIAQRVAGLLFAGRLG